MVLGYEPGVLTLSDLLTLYRFLQAVEPAIQGVVMDAGYICQRMEGATWTANTQHSAFHEDRYCFRMALA